jgi:hypothetical protein
MSNHVRQRVELISHVAERSLPKVENLEILSTETARLTCNDGDMYSKVPNSPPTDRTAAMNFGFLGLVRGEASSWIRQGLW